jgi:hypothetical protein
VSWRANESRNDENNRKLLIIAVAAVALMLSGWAGDYYGAVMEVPTPVDTISTDKASALGISTLPMVTAAVAVAVIAGGHGGGHGGGGSRH